MWRVRKGVAGVDITPDLKKKLAIPFYTAHADITGRMNRKRNESE